MRPTRVFVLAVAVLAALPAAAAAEKPSFDGKTDDSVRPGFDWKIRDYVATCSDDSLTLEVDGQKGWRTRLPGSNPIRGDVRYTTQRSVGEGVDFTFKRKGDGLTRHFHVRCLPPTFGDYTFDRIRSGGPKYFFMQMDDDYVAIFDRNGVPIWWEQADGSGADAKLLPDGTISWNTGSGVIAGDFEIRTLDGRLIRTVGDPNTTDIHDLQLLPNGNYVIGMLTFANVDASHFGGESNWPAIGTKVEEVTPDGDLVRQWDSNDELDLDQTGRWWPEIVSDDSALWYDVSHWNAVGVDGRFMYLSFRNLDALYKVDRKTGEIIWKLGGAETPESLEILHDPVGDYPLGGQHDVRVQPNGTITVFNNRTDLNDAVPRAERFRIDEDAGTATLVETVEDRKVKAAFCCGSARRLSSKDWLVSWGNNGIVGAYDPDGRTIFRLTTAGAFSYRANPVLDGELGGRELRRAMDRMNR